MNEEVNWDLMYGADEEGDDLDLDPNLKIKKESKKEIKEAIASYIG